MLKTKFSQFVHLNLSKTPIFLLPLGILFWEYHSRKQKTFECTNANNNIESRFHNMVFFYQLWCKLYIKKEKIDNILMWYNIFKYLSIKKIDKSGQYFTGSFTGY